MQKITLKHRKITPNNPNQHIQVQNNTYKDKNTTIIHHKMT